MMRIGVDMGGTKIEAAVLDDAGGVVARRRIPTPHDYRAAVAAVAALVDELAPGADRVGVGAPGSPNPRTGLIRNANSVWLNGRPLAADLEAALGRPVRVANDADCFALSEATDGAAAGAASVFGVILGTGVGGGLVVDGRLQPGAGGVAGEWGHTPLPWAGPQEHPGPTCWCGRRGCVETWLSGPGWRARHGAAFAEERTPQDLASAADDAARASRALYADRLARGLAVVAAIVDPAVFVLGGGLSNMQGLAAAAQQALARYAFTDAPGGRIVTAAHGDSSGVRGAAWLWASR